MIEDTAFEFRKECIKEAIQEAGMTQDEFMDDLVGIVICAVQFMSKVELLGKPNRNGFTHFLATINDEAMPAINALSSIRIKACELENFFPKI